MWRRDTGARECANEALPSNGVPAPEVPELVGGGDGSAIGSETDNINAVMREVKKWRRRRGVPGFAFPGKGLKGLKGLTVFTTPILDPLAAVAAVPGVAEPNKEAKEAKGANVLRARSWHPWWAARVGDF